MMSLILLPKCPVLHVRQERHYIKIHYGFHDPLQLLNYVCLFFFFRRETVSDLLDHMLHDVQLHPDVALVNGISVLLTLLEVRKGR